MTASELLHAATMTGGRIRRHKIVAGGQLVAGFMPASDRSASFLLRRPSLHPVAEKGAQQPPLLPPGPGRRSRAVTPVPSMPACTRTDAVYLTGQGGREHGRAPFASRGARGPALRPPSKRVSGRLPDRSAHGAVGRRIDLVHGYRRPAVLAEERACLPGLLRRPSPDGKQDGAGSRDRFGAGGLARRMTGGTAERAAEPDDEGPGAGHDQEQRHHGHRVPQRAPREGNQQRARSDTQGAGRDRPDDRPGTASAGATPGTQLIGPLRLSAIIWSGLSPARSSLHAAVRAGVTPTNTAMTSCAGASPPPDP